MKKNMLEALFPDDNAARNRQYATESIASLEAEVAAGRCSEKWAGEQIDFLKCYRDAP